MESDCLAKNATEANSTWVNTNDNRHNDNRGGRSKRGDIYFNIKVYHLSCTLNGVFEYNNQLKKGLHLSLFDGYKSRPFGK